jgi:hypothetical protein
MFSVESRSNIQIRKMELCISQNLFLEGNIPGRLQDKIVI